MPRAQVPREMATGAGSTPNRARIINKAGDHCWTGPPQFREGHASTRDIFGKNSSVTGHKIRSSFNDLLGLMRPTLPMLSATTVPAGWARDLTPRLDLSIAAPDPRGELLILWSR